MTDPCWIFDIDGTIADLSHRLHYIQSKPRNWEAFRSSVLKDKVIEPVAKLLRTQYALGMGIVLCSGRNEVTRSDTEQWLRQNNLPYNALYMRQDRDFRVDSIIKSELLDRILADNWSPRAVVDDRLSVCRMWHSRGVFVFCVNQGFVEF